MQLNILSCAEHLDLQAGEVHHTLTLSLGSNTIFDVLVSSEVYAAVSASALRTPTGAIPAKMPMQEVEHTFGGDYASEPEAPKPAPVVYADDWGNPIVPSYPQHAEDPDAEAVPSI